MDAEELLDSAEALDIPENDTSDETQLNDAVEEEEDESVVFFFWGRGGELL